ncbi:MAG: GAF domain-containing sensor histidine kinase [Anaerolineae bacterium]|nr:GAF domain-containing sensor histidine kinase [Anaerolineae bacterium]
MGEARNANSLINILTLLDDIGRRVNHLDGKNDLRMVLTLIAEGAVRTAAQRAGEVTGAAWAVIWLYDEAGQIFEPQTRIAVGDPDVPAGDDYPRPNGFGMRAIRQRRRCISYETTDLAIQPARQQVGAETLVCYPLLVAQEAVGAFYLYRQTPQPFDDIDLLIFDILASQAAIAIYHGRQIGGLNKTLARRVREMEKLNWASHLINSRTKLDETLQEILTIGLDLTAGQYGSLELYDKKHNLLRTRALAGSGEASLSTLPPLLPDEASVIGWVALNRQSLLIKDLKGSNWHEVYRPLPVGKPMCSELAVPLLTREGDLVGVLNIESPQSYAFTDLDQQLLETLAYQAVTAIEEVRLLDALQEIVAVLLNAPIDDLFELIIERACELLNMSAGAIWTLSEPDTLVLRRSNDGRRSGQKLVLKGSLAGQAIQFRQPITIDDVRLDPNFRPKKLAVKKGWVSAIVAPLLSSRDEPSAVGSFSLYATRLRDFSDWDKKLLTCLANHAAVAIRDAEHRTRLKQAQERQVLAETFAAVGDVAANLVHQLNNKFGAISVRVQGIEEKCETALDNSPYLAENLAEIAQSSRQAMDLVRDSMAHLRLPRPQPVDLSHCVDLALKRAAPGAGIEVQRHLSQLPRVLAGERQLEMVFYNLFDNAVKAMAGTGVLTITGQAGADEVSVTVADTGPGIPESLQGRIFEFDTTLPRGPQASGRLGFGLWWVKTFVDRFGGRVTVQSKEGQGSVFTIWLPVKKETY